MPRKGPRRTLVALRLDAEGIAYIDETAAEEQVLDESGNPNRSEMIRIMLAYARLHRPTGWRPPT